MLLAFVTFVVWTQFNEARGFVEQESNELLDLYRTARGLPEPTRAQVHQLARDYVRVVLDSEWEAMACSGPLAPGAGAAIIDQMWGAVHAMEPQAEADSSVYREVLRRLDDVSDLRSSRLGSSRARMPAALRIFSTVGRSRWWAQCICLRSIVSRFTRSSPERWQAQSPTYCS